MTRALGAADALDFVSKLPRGLDTALGQRGRTLSGGQPQKLAVARSLLRDASVLVLDEPTTGLDPTSTERITGPLTRLMSGRTTIVISHNFRLASRPDHIIVLDEGAVVERGTHDELMSANGMYRRLYESAVMA